MELVKAFIDKEDPPGHDRFWHAMCEETLANYLWQHSKLPADHTLCVEEFSSGLKRWVTAVLQGGAPQ